MNAHADAVRDSSIDPQGIAPAAISPGRLMYWSVRREVWENRSIYIAPLIVAAVVLFGSFISTLGLSKKLRATAQDPAGQVAAISAPYKMAPAPIMLTTFLVGFFYCLDGLYGERRDRSILFWKSLPVSDLTTVLSKAVVPLLLLPAIALLLSVVVQLVLMPLTMAVLIRNGVSAATLWTGLPEPLVMIYGLTVHMLWFAPIYCWLLLLSAWVRRATILWVVLPPLAIVIAERIVFSTSYFGNMLKYRVVGAMSEAFANKTRGDHDLSLTPLNFLVTPGLWVGLGFAAVCLALAVRLRRNREPI